MSSTRERDAFPKTLSRCTRFMFSSTEASTSQWESSVFVSPIKAPALIILDEYGAEDRSRFSKAVVLADMVLMHRLPEFEFQSLAVLLDHLHQERRRLACPLFVLARSKATRLRNSHKSDGK